MGRLDRWLHRLRATASVRPDPLDAPLLDADALRELAAQACCAPHDCDTRKDVAQRAIGDAPAVTRGYGGDYEESRTYQPGDELRFMNWRLLARTGVPFVKVFREERQPGGFVLIDRRASMRFGTRRRLKVTQAARVAAWCAFRWQRRRVAIGGLLLEQPLRWFPQTQHPDGVLRMVQAGGAPCPPLSCAEQPSLEYVLKLLVQTVPRGSQLLLISDWHDLTEAARPSLLALSAQHHVRAVRVLDAAEHELPDAGRLQLCLPGTNAALDVDTSAPTRRTAYAAAAAAYLEERRQMLAALDIPVLDIAADLDDLAPLAAAI